MFLFCFVCLLSVVFVDVYTNQNDQKLNLMNLTVAVKCLVYRPLLGAGAGDRQNCIFSAGVRCKFSGNFLISGNVGGNFLLSGNSALYKGNKIAAFQEICKHFRKF